MRHVQPEAGRSANMFRSSTIAAALLTAFAMDFSSPARADWPQSAVHIVVPFPPGGAPDALARLVADRLAAELKQSVVVENRVGAGGILASGQIARAKADGYTLLLSGLASHVVAPLVNPNATYDPISDFTHIAYLGGPPMVLVVTPSTGMRSIDDLAEQAKAGRLIGYTTLGAGTVGHLLVEYIAKKKGVQIQHIPFNQVPVAEVLSGRVPVGAFAWGAVLGQIEAGKLRPIAVGTASRLSEFADGATFKDQGLDLIASTWVALSAPAGLPAHIVQRLNREVQNIMQSPDVRQRLEREAVEMKQMSPSELTHFYETELARWRTIAQESGFGNR
jgi:tripartite-type tricarboxylate transporter receptor subunit TctC